jgi:hypothetical protein
MAAHLGRRGYDPVSVGRNHFFASSRRPITFCYVGSNGIMAQTPQEI